MEWYDSLPTEYLPPLIEENDRQIEQAIGVLEALWVTKQALERTLRARNGACTLPSGEYASLPDISTGG